MASEMFWQNKFSDYHGRFNYIFQRSLFTDVSIIIKGREFKTHKLLLACNSPYFEGTFFGPLARSSESIELDVDADAFQAILGFMYTGDLLIQEPDMAITVFQLADRFLIENLKEICRRHIEKNINIRNVCQVANMFSLYAEKDIISACVELIANKTESIIFLKEFEEINKEVLLMVLKEDQLDIRSEIQLFKVVEKWLLYQMNQPELDSNEALKKSLFYEVIRNIRFNNILPDEFPESSVINKYMNEEDKEILLAPSREHLPDQFCTRRRKCKFTFHPTINSCVPTTLPVNWKHQLQHCVVRNDIRGLKKLAALEANFNVRYDDQATLLHIAAYRSKPNVVRFLLGHIPASFLDGNGCTPLHLSVLWRKIDNARIFLEIYEVEYILEIRNKDGQTVLDLAYTLPHSAQALRRLIVDSINSKLGKLSEIPDYIQCYSPKTE